MYLFFIHIILIHNHIDKRTPFLLFLNDIYINFENLMYVIILFYIVLLTNRSTLVIFYFMYSRVACINKILCIITRCSRFDLQTSIFQNFAIVESLVTFCELYDRATAIWFKNI